MIINIHREEALNMVFIGFILSIILTILMIIVHLFGG